MPGKEIRLIEKVLHADGYYYYTASEAATASTSELASEEEKGLIREEEKEEQAAAILVKEEIPTPRFALVKESVEDDYTSSCSTFQSKLDATKRKMHDSYQQLANAKKQRRIQVIDPRDLPPPPPTQSSSKGKVGAAVAARKKMINISTTTNRKTMSNNNLFNGGGLKSRLVKPTSLF